MYQKNKKKKRILRTGHLVLKESGGVISSV